MSKGTLVIAGGALLVIICFFLPWVTIIQLDHDLTGLNLATGTEIEMGGQVVSTVDAKPEYWVILGCAVACLALVAAVFMGRIAIKPASFLAIALVVLGVVMFFIRYQSSDSTSTRLWVYLLYLGELQIVAGAVWNLLGKRA
jgi:hypothetical protein